MNFATYWYGVVADLSKLHRLRSMLRVQVIHGSEVSKSIVRQGLLKIPSSSRIRLALVEKGAVLAVVSCIVLMEALASVDGF